MSKTNTIHLGCAGIHRINRFCQTTDFVITEKKSKKSSGSLTSTTVSGCTTRNTGSDGDGIDPLAEKRFFSTPYGYCLGNPIVNIDLHGLIDWKVVGKGVFQTASGVGMMLTGGAWTAGTGGAGALFGGGALIMGGLTNFSFGLAKIAVGFANDGSEKSQQITDSMPTSLLDVGGIVVDQAMGNENGEARSVAKVVEGTVGIATSR